LVENGCREVEECGLKLRQDFRVGAIDVKIGRGFEGRDKFGRVVTLDDTGLGGKNWLGS
jgi:hypothetical protein